MTEPTGVTARIPATRDHDPFEPRPPDLVSAWADPEALGLPAMTEPQTATSPCSWPTTTRPR